ncbi:MAG: 50S ribosomal protein L13 [Candidatus Odinarchaeum yellowstonii]|jgi:large subunit ribosomal protein L13|uniref:Large ribosomal subunit protein uL13 n=1 Tax=Odinarchaeota yellowstonii (strain LCB_4) TaxID=1841599 RepID=A0AAF0D0Z7_ODILC|nr:MAG: 50S ribosomal protein L13 [Candidatus Odinarchaeum yellowstonii]
MSEYKIIDATNAILGRLSSIVAKRLLEGDKIMIINAEKAVISGKKHQVIAQYKAKTNIRTATAPWKGPFHYKRPDRILKRTVRGMLPFKTTRGREAYRRLKVYIGVPEGVKLETIETIKDVSAGKLKNKYITIKELSKELGWIYEGD